MTKIYIKHLPKKSELKNYFNINSNNNFTVKKVDYNTQCIFLECTIKPNYNYYISKFYCEVFSIDFKNNKFTLMISRKYWDHIVRNFENNYEYLKQLK